MDHGKSVWCEDECTPGTPGHVTIDDARWERFHERYDQRNAVEKEDHGDSFYCRMPNGFVTCHSYIGHEIFAPPDPPEVPAEQARAVEGAAHLFPFVHRAWIWCLVCAACRGKVARGTGTQETFARACYDRGWRYLPVADESLGPVCPACVNKREGT